MCSSTALLVERKPPPLNGCYIYAARTRASPTVVETGQQETAGEKPEAPRDADGVAQQVEEVEPSGGGGEVNHTWKRNPNWPFVAVSGSYAVMRRIFSFTVSFKTS